MATKFELISMDTLAQITGAVTIPEIYFLWDGVSLADILYNHQVRGLLTILERYTTSPVLILSLSRNAVAERGRPPVYSIIPTDREPCTGQKRCVLERERVCKRTTDFFLFVLKGNTKKALKQLR